MPLQRWILPISRITCQLNSHASIGFNNRHLFDGSCQLLTANCKCSTANCQFELAFVKTPTFIGQLKLPSEIGANFGHNSASHTMTCSWLGNLLRFYGRLKPLLPKVRIYAYAYKKHISVNTDMRIYAGWFIDMRKYAYAYFSKRISKA